MFDRIRSKVLDKDFTVGIIGLGYVGLPLIIEFCKAGYRVIGYDIDQEKTKKLSNAESYINHISSTRIQELLESQRCSFTNEDTEIHKMDAILICVPTPLTPQRDPDMSYVESSCRIISKNIKKDQIVVLESTTYPGTTEELMRPILEESGLKANVDFILGYSPEREDPNNKQYSTQSIPKIVSCDNKDGLELIKLLYSSIVEEVVVVSSVKVAEATKLVENIYRSINIALVNELKILFTKMDIDVWEVIKAASTKPFGYQAFFPGPGLGGHCIPIDPFYLTWKARAYDLSTKFIELAGEINNYMPQYVVDRLSIGLNQISKSVKSSKILIVGLAYKKDVDDMRESPSIAIMDILNSMEAKVSYYDPYIPVFPKTREHLEYQGLKSIDLNFERDFDAILILTDHSRVDYSEFLKMTSLIVDTRNVYNSNDEKTVIIKA